MNIHTRMQELAINTDINAFKVTNVELFNAIAEQVDLETVTDHELREIFFIVREQLQNLNWKELVAGAVEDLPFGLNQTLQAWEGVKPCIGCPDAMIEDDLCYHKNQCKTWDIYEYQNAKEGKQ